MAAQHCLLCIPQLFAMKLSPKCTKVVEKFRGGACTYLQDRPSLKLLSKCNLLLIHFVWVRILLAYISRPYFGLEVL